jgi:hypothetical protein
MKLRTAGIVLDLPAAAGAELVIPSMALLTWRLPCYFLLPLQMLLYHLLQLLLLQLFSWVSALQRQMLPSWVLPEHWQIF